MAKKSKKKCSKGVKTGSTAEAPPLPPSTSTAATHTPVTINDLPDELLDPIAAQLHGDEASLRHLARVARRFHEPSRRHSQWNIKGLHNALALLDLVLEFPSLAPRLRHLSFVYQYTEEWPALSDRGISILVRECTQLRILHLRGLIGDATAVARLFHHLGEECPHLVDLTLCYEHGGQLDFPILEYGTEAFARLRKLKMGIEGCRPYGRPFPLPVPSFQIKDVTLDVQRCTVEEFDVVWRLFVSHAGQAHVSLGETGGGFSGPAILKPKDITAVFEHGSPRSMLYLSLHTLSDCFDSTKSLPLPASLETAAVWLLSKHTWFLNKWAFIGSWSSMKSTFWAAAEKYEWLAAAHHKLEIRRGRGMSESEALELKSELDRKNMDVEWLD